MATVTKRRARRAAKRLEKHSRAVIRARNPLRTGPHRLDDPPFPEDPGSAGVREPRRPRPTMPAASVTLDPPVSTVLDLTRG